MRSHFPGRRKLARRLLREQRVFVRARRKEDAPIAVLGSVLFVLIVSLLFTRSLHERALPADLGLGSIARAELRATRDVQYEDAEATRDKGLEAVRAVLPVYDADPAGQERLFRDLSAVFSAGRARVEEALEGSRPPGDDVPRVDWGAQGQGARAGGPRFLGTLSREEAHRRFAPLFRPLAPQEPAAHELDVMLRWRFAQALEKGMMDAAADLLASGYRGDRYMDEEATSARIVVRRLPGGVERETDAAGVVRSRDEAQQRLARALSASLPVPEEDAAALAGFLARAVRPNLFFNRDATLQRRQAVQAGAGRVLVQIPKGTVIVRKGEEISEGKLEALRALREHGRSRSADFPVFLGTALIVSLLVLVQWRYLREQPRLDRLHRSTHLLLLLIAFLGVGVVKLYLMLAAVIQESASSLPWTEGPALKLGAPFAVGAMLAVLVVDSQAGYVFGMIFSLLLGFVLEGDAGLMLFAFLGNMAAIYGLSLSAQKQRRALWKAGFVVAAANALVVAGMALRAVPFPSYGALAGQLALGVSGPVLLTLPVVYVAMYLLETLFGLTTDMRLLELSSAHEPLLKELQMQAPGTFQHSLTVANLAESAAEAVRANPLLARVAALYHDVGKTGKPEYFIENQEPGANVHDKLAPSMSALILISHVKHGLELAAAHKLPAGIRDVIRQHHGTKLIRFFYEKAREGTRPGNGVVKESDYRYPGPKPQSREAAIIMLADAVEAAARTVSDPTPAKLSGMIHKVVESASLDQQLDECDVTLRDLEKISHAFLRVLASVHHQRVDYPGFRFERGDPDRGAGRGRLLDWRIARHRELPE